MVSHSAQEEGQHSKLEHATSTIDPSIDLFKRKDMRLFQIQIASQTRKVQQIHWHFSYLSSVRRALLVNRDGCLGRSHEQVTEEGCH